MSAKKDEKTIRRHTWPPPKESERVVTPYYFVTTEEKGAITHYTLVRIVNGKPAHVIGTTKYKDLLETIIQDSLVPVFKPTQRQYIEATLGEARWMYNVANGDEPDNYEYTFAPPPEYFIKPDFEERDKDAPEKPAEAETAPEPEPSKPVPQPNAQAGARICPKHNVPKRRNGCNLCRRESVPATDGGVYESACPKHGRKQKDGINKKTGRQTYKCPKCTAERMTIVEEMTQMPTSDANDMPPKCPEHNVTKVKDGHKRRGARRWRCLVCNPRVREGTPRAAGGQLSGLAVYHAAKVKDHPLCETCSEHARIEKRIVRAEDGATIIYWTCTVNGCKQVHAPTVKELPVEEIERRITGAVAQANGHDPQNRSDIVNELIRRLLAKEITLTQVTSRTTVREVAKEINSLYQDKYGKDSPLPLDAPMPGKDGDDSKKTYADQLESRGMNPEEELIAKEAGAGEE